MIEFSSDLNIQHMNGRVIETWIRLDMFCWFSLALSLHSHDHMFTKVNESTHFMTTVIIFMTNIHISWPREWFSWPIYTFHDHSNHFHDQYTHFMTTWMIFMTNIHISWPREWFSWPIYTFHDHMNDFHDQCEIVNTLTPCVNWHRHYSKQLKCGCAPREKCSASLLFPPGCHKLTTDEITTCMSHTTMGENVRQWYDGGWLRHQVRDEPSAKQIWDIWRHMCWPCWTHGCTVQYGGVSTRLSAKAVGRVFLPTSLRPS